MIRLNRAAVASSIQDLGRSGHRAAGHARSGAMDPLSLRLANRAAGAAADAAAVELGPGPLALEALADVRVAFGGAPRDGAPWWTPLELRRGQTLELGSSREGVWSYLALGGGVDAPVVLGSRAATVREGIGSWLGAGDVVGAAGPGREPLAVDAVPMRGPVRIFGELPGAWRVGRRTDRMAYALDGEPVRGGPAEDWSEPLLPGFIQLPPSGMPMVLMPEGPTVGGYSVAAVVHSEDVRLVAQTRPGEPVRFEEIAT